MKAAVLKEPRHITIEERPLPAPGSSEVVIQVMYVGYCGTDVMVWAGNYRARYPVVPGHEFVGKVLSVGSAVEGVRAGDIVAPEASYPCGACAMCSSGLEEYCRNRVSLGRMRDGAMAEYVVVPAKIAHRVDERIDPRDAQSLVGVACAVRAVAKSSIATGTKVAIIGSGHSALLLLQVARAAGADGIAILGGSRKSHLALARHLGADLVVGYSDPDTDRLLGGFTRSGFDVVFEASGQPESLNKAIALVRPGGVVTVFSTYREAVDHMQGQELYYKEITIRGSKSGTGGYEAAIDLLASGKVQVGPMITHEVTLEEVRRGFELAESRDESVFRVIMRVVT
ncbi:MAG: alcohol dehydrogenase catalytic domain-containing protein [Firmicutes bacterium]|nr:alcohol dehydrogenase catalytic domain-containing protein [Bacillota bacterium]